MKVHIELTAAQQKRLRHVGVAALAQKAQVVIPKREKERRAAPMKEPRALSARPPETD